MSADIVEKLAADLQDYADGLGAAPIIVHDRDELSGLLVRAAAEIVRLRGEVATERAAADHWMREANNEHNLNIRLQDIAPAEAKGCVHSYRYGAGVEPYCVQCGAKEADEYDPTQPADGGALGAVTDEMVDTALTEFWRMKKGVNASDHRSHMRAALEAALQHRGDSRVGEG